VIAAAPRPSHGGFLVAQIAPGAQHEHFSIAVRQVSEQSEHVLHLPLVVEAFVETRGCQTLRLQSGQAVERGGESSARPPFVPDDVHREPYNQGKTFSARSSMSRRHASKKTIARRS